MKTSIGTNFYKAPEIGRGNYTASVDIYSLGVSFFQLINLMTIKELSNFLKGVEKK